PCPSPSGWKTILHLCTQGVALGYAVPVLRTENSASDTSPPLPLLLLLLLRGLALPGAFLVAILARRAGADRWQRGRRLMRAEDVVSPRGRLGAEAESPLHVRFVAGDGLVHVAGCERLLDRRPRFGRLQVEQIADQEPVHARVVLRRRLQRSRQL